MGKNESRWVRIFHRVDVGYYSMRNRNWDEYECPKCLHRFDRWSACCKNCGVSLSAPIQQETKFIDE